MTKNRKRNILKTNKTLRNSLGRPVAPGVLWRKYGKGGQKMRFFFGKQDMQTLAAAQVTNVRRE